MNIILYVCQSEIEKEKKNEIQFLFNLVAVTRRVNSVGNKL